MHIDLGMARGAKTKNEKLRIIRRAATEASTKYGIGGRPKTRGGVAPVTLPKLKCLDDK